MPNDYSTLFSTFFNGTGIYAYSSYSSPCAAYIKYTTSIYIYSIFSNFFVVGNVGKTAKFIIKTTGIDLYLDGVLQGKTTGAAGSMPATFSENNQFRFRSYLINGEAAISDLQILTNGVTLLWPLQEGQGNDCYDVNDVADGLFTTAPTFEDSDLSSNYNQLNGFTEIGGVKIPADLSNPGYDCAGNILSRKPGNYIIAGDLYDIQFPATSLYSSLGLNGRKTFSQITSNGQFNERIFLIISMGG